MRSSKVTSQRCKETHHTKRPWHSHPPRGEPQTSCQETRHGGYETDTTRTVHRRTPVPDRENSWNTAVRSYKKKGDRAL